MTNKQVKEAFARRERGNSQHLSSDGTSLWSYGWWEIARWVGHDSDGGPYVVVRNGKSYSTTTATKHRSGVVGETSAIVTPVKQGTMNVQQTR